MTAPAVGLAEADARYGEEAVTRAYRHAFWRQGDLRYLLHDGQLRARAVARAARAAGHRFVLNTGRRWGKTRFFVEEAAECCLSKPGARVPYAAPTETQIAEFVLPHLHQLREDAPKELRPEPKSGDWVFPNGSRIVLSGCEDRRKADRLRGPTADLAILDEAGYVPITDYVVKSVLGPQLWTTGGQMLVSSTPPESPDHPFVALLMEAQAQGAYYHETTAQAPHITPELLAKAIADCGGVDTIAWRREGLAEIIVDPTQTVLPEFGDVHVREYQRPAYFFPHVVGDLGYEDATVILFGYYDFEHDVDVVERELVLRHTRSDEIRDMVSAIERELWPKMRVHMRKIDAQPITRADLSRDHDDESQRWQATRKDDVHAAVNALRVRLSRRTEAGAPRIVINPLCTTTIAHARFARWNRQRTTFERPENREHHYDGCAALVYMHRSLDRVANPIPRLEPGVTLDTHHVKPAPKSPADKLFRARWKR